MVLHRVGVFLARDGGDWEVFNEYEFSEFLYGNKRYDTDVRAQVTNATGSCVRVRVDVSISAPGLMEQIEKWSAHGTIGRIPRTFDDEPRLPWTIKAVSPFARQIGPFASGPRGLVG